jgi:NADP-dependent alcohol dehydrogenase
MNNFVFQNPTKLIFGKGEIKRLSKLIDKDKKILMTYGGGSIKRNGVYEQVMQALEGYDIVEFSGIEANPDYSTLMKAVDICKTQNIDFILAVGGGSIIDGTKFIEPNTDSSADDRGWR